MKFYVSINLYQSMQNWNLNQKSTFWRRINSSEMLKPGDVTRFTNKNERKNNGWKTSTKLCPTEIDIIYFSWNIRTRRYEIHLWKRGQKFHFRSIWQIKYTETTKKAACLFERLAVTAPVTLCVPTCHQLNWKRFNNSRAIHWAKWWILSDTFWLF